MKKSQYNNETNKLKNNVTIVSGAKWSNDSKEQREARINDRIKKVPQRDDR